MGSLIQAEASRSLGRLSLGCRALLRFLITLHGVLLPSSLVLHDTMIVIAIVCLRSRVGLLDTLSVLVSYSRVGAWSREPLLLGLFGIFVAVPTVAYMLRNSLKASPELSTLSKTHQNFTLHPQMFPCRTTHTRFFPKKHSFSYSYLYAGVPIGWVGTVKSFLSADTADPALHNHLHASCGTWFSIDGLDYLQRSTGGKTLVQKLHEYLSSQGASPARYPYVFLLTAPRFLGFSFNPVSFWYLYSEQRQLTAMILEVNNTFDERRMYFMDHTMPPDGQPENREFTFSHCWSKDFHVSPFNDRKGLYHLRARDPFAPDLSGQGYVDNTITLSTPDRKPKLVARVFSDGQPIVASEVSKSKAICFVLKWWWVGFMTNVRIVQEARKLWQKNLQVFYRPEVKPTSIARQASAEEDFLSGSFLVFLRYLQKNSTSLYTIKYTAAAGKHIHTSMTITADLASPRQTADLDRAISIHILTPAFYSSFVQVSDPVEAFQQLCLCNPEQERLATISNPAPLLEQAGRMASCTTLCPESAKLQSCNTRQASRRSQLLRRVACLASTGSPLSGNFSAVGATPLALIDLANLAETGVDARANYQYTKTVLSVLLAQRVALGSMTLLRAYQQMLRVLILWMIAISLQAFGPKLFSASAVRLSNTTYHR
jgi:DUF1365 family protein